MTMSGPTPGVCPRRGSPFTRALARRLLAVFGWRVEGDLPELSRFVLIVAPHTSNWDFPVCVLAMFAVGLQLSWLGKHTLFRFPIAGLLRWLGGEPIDRAATHGTVEVAIANFRSRPQWVLGLSPEGTRRRVAEWRTGFHRIAVGAQVPIVPVRLDYDAKVLGIGGPVWPTSDVAADVARLATCFSREMARHPEQYAEPAVAEPGAGAGLPE